MSSVLGLSLIVIIASMAFMIRNDLGERVAEQVFLGDLYDKLNVFPIQVPPLRERRDDIPLLAHYFRQKFARRMNKPVESISAETTSWLTNSDWPATSDNSRT
jgi:transcriptional regulator with GAF, ATPase, and Fis domain